MKTPERVKTEGYHHFKVPWERLSPRQLAILELMKRGHLNKEIGHALGIKEATIKNHASAIYIKLGVENKTSAVVEGLRLGIIKLE